MIWSDKTKQYLKFQKDIELKKILTLCLITATLFACTSSDNAKKEADLVEPRYKTFVEESISRYMTTPDEFEDYLFLAVSSEKSQEEIINALRDISKIPDSEITSLIDFILQKSEIDALPYSDEEGGKQQTDALLQSSLNLFSKSSASPYFTKTVIDTWLDTAGCLVPDQLDRLSKRDDGFRLILENGGLSRCPEAVSWVYTNFDNTAAIDLFVINETHLGDTHKLLLSKRLFENDLITTDENTRLYLTGLYLDSLYKLGYVPEYESVLQSLPDSIRNKLIRGVNFNEAIELNGYSYPLEGAYFHFYYETLAEFLTKGNKDRAEAFKNSHFVESLHTSDLLNSLIENYSSNVDLYDYFIGSSTSSFYDENEGAYWKLKGQAPGFRMLGAKIAIDNGYAHIGNSLANSISLNSALAGTYQSAWNEVLSEHVSYENHREFITQIDDARVVWLRHTNQLVGFEEEQSNNTNPVSLFTHNRNVYFKERLMSAGDDTPNTHLQSTANLSLPIQDWSVVRVDQDGEEAFVIYQNHDVDPVGEVSGGGYWLIHSTDNGVTWSNPLYLGIQANQPYEVVRDSKLSMRDGEFIRIEVKSAAIDPTSISFPPVGLRIDTDERSFYLEYKLSDIYKDSDNDGLTDILEEKLGLNALVEDTDEDGLIDSKDPLPFVKYSADPNDYSFLLETVLDNIVGFEEQAIVVNSRSDQMIPLPEDRAEIDKMYTLFLMGNRDNYTNLQLPVRTIVLSSQEIARVRDKWGIFYPIYIELFVNKSSNKAYVKWSAGWAGGTIIFEKSNSSSWTVKDGSHWIT